MEAMEIKVPDIGDYKDVPVIEVHVKPGDMIAAEETMLTLESDKATLEVPSPATGIVREIMIKAGDRVSEGTPVLVLGASSDKAIPQTAAPSRQQHVQDAVVSPSLAGGLELTPWPKIDFARFGEVESMPLSRIKKISGANLHRNWVMIPHVTSCDEADITELEIFRARINKEHEKQGIRMTMLAFMIKAAAVALKKFPRFNASLDGDNLVLKKYFNIGFAADTPHGLVVPVIREAERKGVIDIAKEAGELAGLAREGRLKPEQMQGGCFTISSLGGIGGTYFTPIINAPEVAILGACRSYQKPVWDGKQFVPRLTLPLALSWDHRVIDGAEAARFNVCFGQLMADFRRLAL